MRKLSEIRGENALDVLADLLEPVSEIFMDEEFKSYIKNHDKISAVRHVLKYHKESTLNVLALLEGVNRDEYNPSLVDVPKSILYLLNDPDIVSLFFSQSPENFSGRAMENTTGIEHE